MIIATPLWANTENPPDAASIVKMQDEFKEFMEATEDNTAGSRFIGKSAADIAKQSIKGKQLQKHLEKEAGDIIDAGMLADTKAQKNHKNKAVQDITAVDAIQRSYVDMENLSATNSKGELKPGFIEALAEDKDNADIVSANNNKQRPAIEYTETITTEKATEKYKTQCTQSLLDNSFSVVSDLIVEFTQKPHKVSQKTISASFASRTYDRNNFIIDFKNGKIREAQGNEGTRFNIDGKLKNNFSQTTKVTLKKQILNNGDNIPIGNVSFSTGGITAHPSFANNFVAKFNIIQSAIKGRHGKARRNQYRGGKLVYEFIDIKKYPVNITKEYWKHDTVYDELVSLGVCKKVATVCLSEDKDKTRTIGHREPYTKLTRDCWRQLIRYKCDIPQGDNDCGSIPDNCIEEKEEYVTFFDKKAVAIKHFNCEKTITKTKRTRVKQPLQTKDINDYQKNTDMSNAVVAFGFANEMAGQFKRESADKIAPTFFNGEGLICNYTKGCCVDKDSGWRKLFHCNEQEKKLAAKNQAKACAIVGTFKQGNSLLQKIRKVSKVGYCCFDSQLGRIIQQGANKQLGKSFAKAEEPICRALTVEELSQLDFSSDDYDFSDLINELKNKAKNASVSTDKMRSLQAMLQKNVSAKLTTDKNQIKSQQQLQKTQQQKQAQTIEQKIRAKKLEDVIG